MNDPQSRNTRTLSPKTKAEMMTPIEVTWSNLPGNMAHMMPAQNQDPKEYWQVQRWKEDNVPKDVIDLTNEDSSSDEEEL